MDDLPNLSQYRDVLSEMLRKKGIGQHKIKKRPGAAILLVTFL